MTGASVANFVQLEVLIIAGLALGQIVNLILGGVVLLILMSRRKD